MNELLFEPGPELDWERVSPELDGLMLELKESEREALLLRYFENRSLAEVGKRFGLSEDAARKRVERALEKLRILFSRRGITATTTLATTLSTHAIQSAPAGLASALTQSALAGAASGTATTVTLLKFMGMTKVQLGIAAAAVVALGTAVFVQHQAQLLLQEQNAALQRNNEQLLSDNEYFSNRLARARARVPQLPAPALQASAAPAVLELGQTTNLYERLKTRELRLKVEQLDSYLKGNNRNAASLLAAYRTTHEPALLDEAMRLFPNDPQVAFEAAFKKEASPEEQRQWIDAFKKSDPDNALANYLSALNYFRSGHSDEAVQEFLSASRKSFQDYTRERCQDDTEAYQAAGFSSADATTAASSQLLLPQLAEVKELGLDMVDLAKSYQQAGDVASSQAALRLAIELGQRYGAASAGEPEISQLVGIAIERIALHSMDANSPYDSSGLTVQDKLNQLTQQNQELKDLAQQMDAVAPKLSDQDWLNYKNRWLMFGEVSAVKWVLSKYKQ